MASTGEAGDGDPGAIIERARARKAAGRLAEADAALGAFVAAVAALRQAGDDLAAGARVGAMVAAGRGHPAELHDLGCLFAERGDDASAAPLLHAAWEALPRQPQVMRNLAQVLMRKGDHAAARELARAQLARRPGDTFALALAAIAATEQGDMAEARRLMDFRRFVRPALMSPPPGYDSLAAFNRALCDTVLARDDLKQNPADRTTRGGRQSGAILPAGSGPLAALQGLIAEAVKAYGAALPREPEHPFLAQRPGALKLHGWATVLDFGGHQQAHIHPSGWLSGVYYPRLPGITADDAGSHAGWLVFGEPSSGFHPKAVHETHSVAPEEGMLVLFPSYFHHRTEPFEGSPARISLAFDLIPAQ